MLREAPKPTPCACCHNASETEVWDLSVCYSCAAAWHADARFNSGTINAALGLSNRVEDFTKANHQRYLVEAKKRTAEWAAERSKARAA